MPNLKPGFHMIATIAVFAAIAVIAEKISDRKDTAFLRSLESGFHMIAAIAELVFSSAIVAIIWKPGFK